MDRSELFAIYAGVVLIVLSDHSTIFPSFTQNTPTPADLMEMICLENEKDTRHR